MCVQRVPAIVQRVSRRIHNNRTLAQIMSFIVVAAVILQIQIIMVIIYSIVNKIG